MTLQVKTPDAGGRDTFLDLPRTLNHGDRAVPRIDAHEGDGVIELTAEVPGVPESAIGVTVDGDVLTLSIGEYDRSAGKRMLFSERRCEPSERSIRLPFAPAPDSVEASVANGLLTVRFPRVEREGARNIAINGARTDQSAQPEEPDSERGIFQSEWGDQKTAAEEPLTLDVQATRIS